MNKGYIDYPTNDLSKDLLGIESYVIGLKNYISNCQTPMTIAIQGEWGSGKTSIMKMVCNLFDDTIINSWFNTWQYSLFDSNNDMSISFIKHMAESICYEKNNKALAALSKTLSFIKTSSLAVIDAVTGGRTADIVETSMDALTTNNVDLSDQISKLKNKFQDCINDTLSKQHKKRVVFFIDDLDRLAPEKSIEILEVLKLFLDCNGCVFVLAIDYSVVAAGVRKKYGNDINDEKARSFFDKIVQLPFKVPVADYQLNKYIKNGFAEIGVNYENEDIIIMESIAKLSLGSNPRGIKRIFNSLLLVKYILNYEDSFDHNTTKQLFATMCLQQSYEEIYDFLIQNCETLTIAVVKNITHSQKFTDFLCEKLCYSKMKQIKINSFFELFIKLFDNNYYSVSENIFSLANAIRLSSTTKSIPEYNMSMELISNFNCMQPFEIASEIDDYYIINSQKRNNIEKQYNKRTLISGDTVYFYNFSDTVTDLFKISVSNHQVVFTVIFNDAMNVIEETELSAGSSIQLTSSNWERIKNKIFIIIDKFFSIL